MATENRAALTWTAVHRWLDRIEMFGWDVRKMRGIDARLLTIAPAFEGQIKAIAGGSTNYNDLSVRRQTQVLRLVRRSLRTCDDPHFLRRDRLRVLVTADWMARCALPVLLERVPAHASGARNFARPLRALGPLLWPVPLIDALSLLSQPWIALSEALDTQRGTREVRAQLEEAEKQTDATLQMVARTLSDVLNHAGESHDAWSCYMALVNMLDSRRGEPDVIITGLLSTLQDVLLSVQPGDSLRSLANRCTWPSLSKTKAA